MKVVFVGAGPGDPDLMTVRAQRLVREARACVFAGSLVDPRIVDLLPQGCERTDSAPLALGGIVDALEDAARRGLEPVRLQTGDPSLYGALREQIRELDRRGVPWEVVPGVSAFLAVAAALGVELTVPGRSQAVVVCRAPGRTPVPAGQEPGNMARTGATVCVYLSSGRILEDACRDLVDGYGRDAQAALVAEATRGNERVLRGPLSEIAAMAHEAGIERTALLVAGPALETGEESSLLYDAGFTHGHRRGAP